MNRGETKTRARRKLDETTATFWTDDDLNDFYESAYWYYWAWMVQATHPVTARATSPDLDIVALQNAIALPSDFLVGKLVERVFDNYTVPVWWKERYETGNYTAGTASTGLLGYSPRIRFVGTDMLLEPTPSENVTGGIRMDYHFIPVMPATDSASPVDPISTMFPELLIERTVRLAKEKEEMIAGGGVSQAATLTEIEQRFKETIELPIMHRVYVEPYGA